MALNRSSIRRPNRLNAQSEAEEGPQYYRMGPAATPRVDQLQEDCIRGRGQLANLRTTRPRQELPPASADAVTSGRPRLAPYISEYNSRPDRALHVPNNDPFLDLAPLVSYDAPPPYRALHFSNENPPSDRVRHVSEHDSSPPQGTYSERYNIPPSRAPHVAEPVQPRYRAPYVTEHNSSPHPAETLAVREEPHTPPLRPIESRERSAAYQDRRATHDSLLNADRTIMRDRGSRVLQSRSTHIDELGRTPGFAQLRVLGAHIAPNDILVDREKLRVIRLTRADGC